MTALSVVQKQELEQGIEELSAAETTELSELETVIEKGLQGFYEVGTALMIIRDSRLYRKSHATFEDYCKNKWDMTRRYADLQIKASQVVKALNENNCSQIPINEAQVRPLTNLETAQLQQQAWKQAVETAPDGKVTADHVGSVAREMHFEMLLAKGQAEVITHRSCEKCNRTNTSKTEPLCWRCRKEEARAKKIAEAREEWEKIPIDHEAEKFALNLVMEVEKLVEGGLVIGKVNKEVLEKIKKTMGTFESYWMALREKRLVKID